MNILLKRLKDIVFHKNLIRNYFINYLDIIYTTLNKLILMLKTFFFFFFLFLYFGVYVNKLLAYNIFINVHIYVILNNSVHMIILEEYTNNL
jgi:hypothetical protein